MDVIKNIQSCITVGTELYKIINEVNGLKYKYSELGNEQLVVVELLFEIKN